MVRCGENRYKGKGKGVGDGEREGRKEGWRRWKENGDGG